MQIDHLAICAATLDEGVAWAEARLGVTLDAGGVHERFGTHNRLLRLGDVYLEVIAPDPGAVVTGARWFGLDLWQGPPRVANWIVRCRDLDGALRRAPDGAGRPVDLHRGDLRWRIAVPDDGSLPYGGGYPTLIEWGDAHPIAHLADRGCRLRRLIVRHPEADAISARLEGHLQDHRLCILPDARTELVALIDTPSGLVEL